MWDFILRKEKDLTLIVYDNLSQITRGNGNQLYKQKRRFALLYFDH